MADIQNHQRRRFELDVGLIMIMLENFTREVSKFPMKKKEFLWRVGAMCPKCKVNFAAVPKFSDEGDKVYAIFNCPQNHEFKNIALER